MAPSRPDEVDRRVGDARPCACGPGPARPPTARPRGPGPRRPGTAPRSDPSRTRAPRRCPAQTLERGAADRLHPRPAAREVDDPGQDVLAVPAHGVTIGRRQAVAPSPRGTADPARASRSPLGCDRARRDRRSARRRVRAPPPRRHRRRVAHPPLGRGVTRDLVVRRHPRRRLRRPPRAAPRPGRGRRVDRPLDRVRAAAAAGRGGVAVPAVRFLLEPDDDLGAGFVMDRIDGETIPRKLLRDDAVRRRPAR